MRPRRLVSLLCAVASALCSTQLFAHPTSFSTFEAEVRGTEVDVRMALDGPSLVSVMVEHLGGDEGLVTGKTIEGARATIVAYVDTKLELSADGARCSPGEVGEFGVIEGGRKLRMARVYSCPSAPKVLEVENQILMEDEGGHRHVALFRAGADNVEHTFSPTAKKFRFELKSAPSAPPDARAKPAERSFTAYFRAYSIEGVRHILFGYDHVLFVITLLVAARRFKDLALVVTSFTIAHSITLVIGAMDWFTLPGCVVEPIIALSIAYVGIENVLRETPKARAAITFAFGLLHGFGFSSALRELGLAPGAGLVPSLFAFNVGVEAGQLLVVAPLFPVIAWFRRKNEQGARNATRAISAVVAVLGLYWAVERAFA